jgi:hypothetical protein
MWCDEKFQLVFRVGLLQPAGSAGGQFPLGLVVLESIQTYPRSVPLHFLFPYLVETLSMDCAFLCLLCVSVGAAQWVFGKQKRMEF